MKLAELVVKMSAETAELKRAFAEVQRESRATRESFEGITDSLKEVAAGYLSLEAGKEIIREIVTKTAELERNNAALRATLQGTGLAAGQTARDLQMMREELSGKTLFDDDALAHAQAVLLTFRSIAGDSFGRVLTDAANLSALLNQDLQSSVVQLGKALEDPVNGLTALRRVGVSFTEAQKLQIQQLMDENRLLDAQAVILKGLEGQLGNVAEEMGKDGLTKSIKDATQAWDDLLKSLGSSDYIQKTWGDRIKGLTSMIDALNLLQNPAIRRQFDLMQVQEQIKFGQKLVADGKGSNLVWNPLQENVTYVSTYLDDLVEKEADLRAAIEATAKAAGHMIQQENARAAAGLARAAKEREADAQALKDAQALDDLIKETDKRQKEVKKFFTDNPPPRVGQVSGAFTLSKDEIDAITSDRAAFLRNIGNANYGKDDTKTAAEIWQETWINAIRGVQADMTDTFDRLFSGQITSAEAFAREILRTVQRTAAQMAAQQVTGGLFSWLQGGRSSGGFGADTFGRGLDLANLAMWMMRGNQAWAFGQAWRQSFSGFNLMPQFHSGGVVGTDHDVHRGPLRGDEYPAILQRGEVVLTPAQLRAVAGAGGGGGGGGVSVRPNFHIYAWDSKDVVDRFEEHADQLAAIVTAKIAGSGTLQRASRGRGRR